MLPAGRLNTIVSTTPGVELDSDIASRSVHSPALQIPLPGSTVELTVNVAALADTAIKKIIDAILTKVEEGKKDRSVVQLTQWLDLRSLKQLRKKSGKQNIGKPPPLGEIHS